jgi:hypothetical protein
MVDVGRSRGCGCCGASISNGLRPYSMAHNRTVKSTSGTHELPLMLWPTAYLGPEGRLFADEYRGGGAGRSAVSPTGVEAGRVKDLMAGAVLSLGLATVVVGACALWTVLVRG